MKFPVKMENVFRGLKLKKGNFFLDQKISSYISTELDMFEFYGENLTNTIDINSDIYSGKNYIEFIGNNSGTLINGYKIHTYTKKESLKILLLLKSNLGVASYDDNGKVERNIIWEFSDRIFIFNQGISNINQQDTVETKLICLNNNLKPLIMNLTSITYYSKYLEERYKENKVISDYSYGKFVDDQQKKGFDYYIKGLVK